MLVSKEIRIVFVDTGVRGLLGREIFLVCKGLTRRDFEGARELDGTGRRKKMVEATGWKGAGHPRERKKKMLVRWRGGSRWLELLCLFVFARGRRR
ncbi:unnamed protein product [Linum trigynum]|uniref:Uncharacterized protein n=1 Tax=Linum trigynum TaxID=586398 RepID=A0AAV2DQ96_9ROSI